jgi:uncharacterized protein YabE (DUF348 family)
MKLDFSRWTEKYWSAHAVGKSHVIKRPYILPLAGVFLALLIVVGAVSTRGGHQLRPSDSHVVFLYDNGKKQTLDTKAQTVGDLVGKLPLNLISQDVVEPAADTKIVEDNFRINVYRARPVTVVDPSTRTVALTAQKSPRVVAESAGLTVYPEDKVTFQQGSIKENVLGEKVVVDRATPVNFNLYGTPLSIRTHAHTVGELLAEKQIKVAQGDTVQPAPDTALTPDMQIFVAKNGTQISTVEEEIPAPVQVVNDNTLSLGATVVRQPGTPGKKVVTYQVQTTNGQETGRVALQEVVVSEPVPQIVARGTIVDVGGDKSALMAAAGISPSDYGYVNYIVSHESGWRTTAQNPSGAYGLCQALPGSKMAGAGPDWQGNPVTQLRWCSSYAVSAYGSWGGAYSFWVSHGWW